MEANQLPKNPLDLFRNWYEEFKATNPPDSTQMMLATATPKGRPAVRTVLLKGYDEAGFTFFTNYLSPKSEELESNPWAELLFFWPPLMKQVRVFGKVEKVSAQESDEYFKSRHYMSQLGAWASKQSSPIENRAILESKVAEYKAKYKEGAVPRPPHWGGWRIKPEEMEFWIGRDSRLHDRFLYELNQGVWKVGRISP